VSTALRPVALSIRNQDMQGDRIFDLMPDGPVDQAPYTPWRLVREFGAEAGLKVMTADRVAAQGIDPRDVAVISYDWPPSTDALVAAGARLAVLTSLEPPVIAWELYYKLPTISTRFPHVYLFGGGARRVAHGTRFHQLHFPQVRRPRPTSWPDWQRRRFLVSINSNKAIVRSLIRWFDRPREVSIKRELASKRYRAIGRDLYLERLRAVEYFAGRPDFDVFGQGWQRKHPAVPARLHQAVLRAYRGPVAEKLATLGNYKFSLCLENSEFEGYVSEKIFDCFFSGTIPIYRGAPDVEHYIPSETFIDLRKIRDYRELERALDGMDESTMLRYREAAAEFVESPQFQRYAAECFAERIVKLLTA
jgi:hypothetical protein